VDQLGALSGHPRSPRRLCIPQGNHVADHGATEGVGGDHNRPHRIVQAFELGTLQGAVAIDEREHVTLGADVPGEAVFTDSERVLDDTSLTFRTSRRRRDEPAPLVFDNDHSDIIGDEEDWRAAAARLAPGAAALGADQIADLGTTALRR
jgi:hypothetical protein